jgi:hypothetical protein
MSNDKYLVATGWFDGHDGQERKPTQYRVTGLAVGDNCYVSGGGADKWKVSWERGGAKFGFPKRTYDSPEEALEAVIAFANSLTT